MTAPSQGLRSRGSVVANVKDYGAVGDGVTNDAAAVQEAYNSLSSGGTLYFPPGTYYLNTFDGATTLGWHKLLLLDQNDTKVVVDRSATIQAHDPNQLGQLYAVFMVIASGVSLTGDGIIRGTQGSSDQQYGIAVVSGYDISINKLQLLSHDTDSIYIGGTHLINGVKIQDCNIRGSGRGNIVITSGKRIVIDNNYLADATTAATGYGIRLEPDASDGAIRDVKITHNNLKNHEGGITIAGSYTEALDTDSLKTKIATSLSQNVYTDAALNGSQGGASFRMPKAVTITTSGTEPDTYDTSTAIRVSGYVEGFLVEDNLLPIFPKGNETIVSRYNFEQVVGITVPAQLTTSGYFDFGTDTGFIVQDILIANGNEVNYFGSKGGIVIGGSVLGGIVTDNITRFGTGNGIVVNTDAQNITFKNNYSYGNNLSGIAVSRNTGDVQDSIIITGNHCFQNRLHGISLGEPVGVSVSDNHAYNNLGHGIFVQGAVSTESTRVSIHHNHAYSNKLTGIKTQRSYSVQIDHNFCYSNYQEGILDDSSTHLKVEGNRCYANSQQTDDTYSNITFDSSHHTDCIGNTCRAGSGSKQPQYGINFNVGGGSDNRMINNNTTTGGRTGTTLVGGSVTAHNEVS